jgi:hypothetical protein
VNTSRSNIKKSGFPTTVSIDESALKTLKIIPNPANAFLKVMGNQPNSQLTLFDLAGKKLNFIVSNQNEINVEQISNGIYFLEAVSTFGEVQRVKIIIQH